MPLSTLERALTKYNWMLILDIVVVTVIIGVSIFLKTYKQHEVHFYFNLSCLVILAVGYVLYLIGIGRITTILHSAQRRLLWAKLLTRRLYRRSKQFILKMKMPHIPYWVYGCAAFLMKVNLLVFTLLMIYVYHQIYEIDKNSVVYIILFMASSLYLCLSLLFNDRIIKRYVLILHVGIFFILISVIKLKIEPDGMLPGSILLCIGLFSLGTVLKDGWFRPHRTIFIHSGRFANMNGTVMNMPPRRSSIRERIINFLFRHVF